MLMMPTTRPTKLFISERALAEIAAETLEHIRTETGGILLGIEEEGNWYAVESLDPGPKAILQPSFFEYDHDYLTHLANKVARRYRSSLRLIGLWHRHPGSLDSFSAVDDTTNLRYAELLGGSAISGLVNVDPDFRLTFYTVTGPPLHYRKIAVELGDRYFPKGLLETWNSRDRIDKVNNKNHDGTRSRVRSYEQRTAHVPRPPREIVVSREERSVRRVRTQAQNEVEDISIGEFFRSLGSWLLPHFDRSRSARPRRSRPQQSGRRSRTDIAADRVQVLKMLDSELGYLETQATCSYSLDLSDERLTITLEKTNANSYLEILFKAEGGNRTVVVGQSEAPFEPGCVEETVRRWINQETAPEPSSVIESTPEEQRHEEKTEHEQT